jgi:hypothetical protein
MVPEYPRQGVCKTPSQLIKAGLDDAFLSSQLQTGKVK